MEFFHKGIYMKIKPIIYIYILKILFSKKKLIDLRLVIKSMNMPHVRTGERIEDNYIPL